MASTALALPPSVRETGISETQWRTLTNSLFPGAAPESVAMVIDYCHARKLDPLKKPCHIVPIRVKDARSGQWVTRDVVMPGIYEYRTTAHRTGKYLGRSEFAFGPDKAQAGVTAPEWCAVTVYRWNPDIRERAAFPVVVYFSECVGVNKEDRANERWSKAPRQMLMKCTEAAALREAFPEELGGESTAEEMDGQHVIDAAPAPTIQQPQRKSETSTGPAGGARDGQPEPPPSTGTPVVEGEPVVASESAVRIVDMARRQSSDGTRTWWIVMDDHDRYYFLLEQGEWHELYAALTRIKGTNQYVELETEVKDGVKYPLINGARLVGGAA